MIAAMAHKAAWVDKLMFNWFDLALVLVLAFGFWRGRKRGMSREALPVSMWLVAVIGAGFGNAWLGGLLLQTGYVQRIFGSSFNERTTALVIAYLAIALVAFGVFSLLMKRYREKLAGSSAFGGSEYYLGMISGMIRYGCIVLFVLSLLHAPVYTSAEIAAREAYENRWYGGGLKGFNGDFVPSLDEVQTSVFRQSLTGPAIQNYFSELLINGVAPVKKATTAQL
jgi:uncharacterized membrane protein required for colicin V production